MKKKWRAGRILFIGILLLFSLSQKTSLAGAQQESFGSSEGPIDLLADSVEDDIKKIQRQIFHINSFVREGGKFVAKAAEISESFKVYCKSVAKVEAKCRRLKQLQLQDQQAYYPELYDSGVGDCEGRLNRLKQLATTYATQVESLSDQAAETSKAVVFALENKKSLTAQQESVEMATELGTVLDEIAKTGKALEKLGKKAAGKDFGP